MELQALLNRIDATKAWIGQRRPLAPEEVKELDAYFRIGTTYSSNALEGNSLTLAETKVLPDVSYYTYKDLRKSHE